MKKHIAYLNVIKTTACELQTRKTTLGNYVDVLDLLNEEIVDGYGVTDHDFEKCLLEPDKFEVGNRYDSGMFIFSDCFFAMDLCALILRSQLPTMLDEHAVRAWLKVQRKQEESLNLSEKRALVPAELVAAGDDNPRPTKKFKEKHLERLQMRAQAGTKTSAYHRGINAIMGSAAVVERHWKSSKRVLTEDRSSMDPLIFEGIMYLKMNKRLWGKAEVVEANKRRKKAIKENHRNLHINLQDKLTAVHK